MVEVSIQRQYGSVGTIRAETRITAGQKERYEATHSWHFHNLAPFYSEYRSIMLLRNICTAYKSSPLWIPQLWYEKRYLLASLGNFCVLKTLTFPGSVFLLFFFWLESVFWVDMPVPGFLVSTFFFWFLLGESSSSSMLSTANREATAVAIILLEINAKYNRTDIKYLSNSKISMYISKLSFTNKIHPITTFTFTQKFKFSTICHCSVIRQHTSITPHEPPLLSLWMALWDKNSQPRKLHCGN